MTHALTCLVGCTLLLCGSVAAMADLARDRQPRVRPESPGAVTATLWVVEGADGRWYVNGEPLTRSRLPNLLAAQPGKVDIRFLPSASLSLGEVARSLAQLRASTPHPVALGLREERP
ncbi:MAG: hypothetical protein ER33_06785 [Cyanobium sp. CACIAM 14]|nr:MAG: hypothetical protein ER33_06785 [Cyanobium sp. CACIAM 14]